MSLSLSPSPSARWRLARAAVGFTLSVGLLAGCAQEEPLEPETTSSQEPDPAPTSEAPTTEATTEAPTTEAPTTEDAATTEAPSAAPDDASSTSAGPAATLEAKDGGFTVDVPQDWEDAIELVDVDTVQLAMKAPEQVDGFFMNVLVTKEEYVRNLTSAVEEAAKELAGDDSSYELLEAAPVDGNKAPGYTIEREVQGKTLVQTQRWISHDGTLYVVTMSALKSQADEAGPILDEILESWRWQD